MTAYYNEIDPYAAQWLRNLIEVGHIAPGVVDERSIEDVLPSELYGYTQCHFFAGIGIWSLALRNAGWPDNKPVWTGSCPCQPFSTAGAGKGFNDERHLWPAFAWLIQQCNPPTIFGEQVASKVVDTWIDLVQIDVETMGYSFGCIPFPSASIGAPHMRDRTYWVAHTMCGRQQESWELGRSGNSTTSIDRQISRTVNDDISLRLANVPSNGCERERSSWSIEKRREQKPECVGKLPNGFEGHSVIEQLADTNSLGFDKIRQCIPSNKCDGIIGNHGLLTRESEPGPVNGLWRNADWLYCRDGRWRSVESGTFPLVNGDTNRVGRLRAYGNAINAEQAKIFIETCSEFLIDV